jgi:hypothetical protein
MRTTVAILFFCGTSAVIIASGVSRRLTTVKGRIIAYRTFDRFAQAPSFIPNREIFLLATDAPSHGRKSRILKIDYRHFELSDITPEMLERSPLLKMRVTRDRSCDESYGQLVSNAPIIEMLDNISDVGKLDDPSARRKTIEPIRFTAGFNGRSISLSVNLECYALEKGNFQVVHQ